MVVILPPFEERAIHETVSRLTPETLKGVMAEVTSGFYSVDDLTVKMPRLKIGQRSVSRILYTWKGEETTYYVIFLPRLELVPSLQKLGIETLFDSSKSDLSGFLQKNSTDRVRA